MTKKIKFKIVIISILSIFIFSCKPPYIQRETQEESFGAAPVQVYKVSRQKISEKLYYTGLIEAWQEIDIIPDIGGKIARIYVNEGDRVQKGQLLAELDTRAARLQHDQAEAGVAVAEANYNDARRNMDRMERLVKENAVSDQQYEKIKLAFDAAKAQFQQAIAVLNLAKFNLDVSIMKAPFSGVIASKNAEVGDVINPQMGGSMTGPGGVLTMIDFSRVKIVLDVSYDDVVRIKKEQPALLRVSAYPDKVFNGRVALVNLAANPMTKKFQVEVLVQNPDLLLRPNTFGEVSLEVSSNEDALGVPQKAILENSYVFVVREDKVQRAEVVLGLQNTDRVEVLQGLREGDIVVIEGNYGLEDGAVIKITEVVEK